LVSGLINSIVSHFPNLNLKFAHFSVKAYRIYLLMEIQINEILIEPKIWQLFYHFENNYSLISEIFGSKPSSNMNNCFFLDNIQSINNNVIESYNFTSEYILL
jgi:hypothetical protein